MGKGKCENCGKEIDDKYKFCFQCSKEMKGNNIDEGLPEHKNSDMSQICKKLDKIEITLEHINWNFGMLVATIRKDTKLVKKLIENEIEEK